jgi:hypothetical protein
MSVGVDDSRNNELAGEVKDGSTGWGRKLGRWSYVADAAVLHQDRDVILWASTGAVDDRGMIKNSDLRRSTPRE